MTRARIAAVAALVLAACLVAWILFAPGRDVPSAPPIASRDAPEGPPTPPQLRAPLRASGRATASNARRDDASEDQPGEPSQGSEQQAYRVRVEVVDSATGRDVTGVELGFFPPPSGATAGRVAGKFVPETDDLRPFTMMFAPPGAASTFHFHVRSHPAGYVAWESEEIPFTPSRYARTLLVVHPLRPELDARVTVLESDGIPVIEAPQMAFDLGAKAVGTAVLEPVSRGTWRIRGVPFQPGETLRLEARRSPVPEPPTSLRTWAPRETHEEEPLAPAEMLSKPQWEGLEPFDRHARIEATITLPPPSILDAELSDHVETDNDLPVEESLGMGGTDDPPPARTVSVTVVAHRRDGRPAAGARVLVGGEERHADAEGRARFAGLRPGLYAIRVIEPGVLPARSETTLAAGADTTVTLTEPEPGRIELAVKDAEDRALPFARIAEVKMPSGLPWLDVDGDVQRVDPYVDHLGRRTLSNVEPGDVRVRVRYGARSGETTVHVSEGAGTRADIVVR